MPDFPAIAPAPLFVNTWCRWAGHDAQVAGAGTWSAALTWPVANMAVYIPFWLPTAYLVRRVGWLNGSSVTTVNVDFGIYSANDGTLIYSTGSTARAGASVMQYVTPTSFVLPSGRYYFGHSCSSTTASRGGAGAIPAVAAHSSVVGWLQETLGSVTLPATMTGIAIANPIWPLCGITSTASGF